MSDYIVVNGNSRVPNATMHKGFNLGTWVSNQKSKYKKGKLTTEEAKRLESLDPAWTWDLMETLWQDFFSELKEFANINGHTNVPYKANGEKSSLGEWVTGQRKFYASGKMDPARKQLLDSIGFRWDPLDPWEEGFENIKQFADREGHTSVTSRHMENGKLLSKWMAHQRSKYRNGQLTKEQIRRLESLPGWEWNPTSKNKN